MDITRRDLLKVGGGALAVGAGVGRPGDAAAQTTPKRGGTFRLRSHVAPVHFDPHQTIAFSTMIPLSFTHSRLVKVKAGSAVVPGTQPHRARPRRVVDASRTTPPTSSSSGAACAGTTSPR